MLAKFHFHNEKILLTYLISCKNTEHMSEMFTRLSFFILKNNHFYAKISSLALQQLILYLLQSRKKLSSDLKQNIFIDI